MLFAGEISKGNIYMCDENSLTGVLQTECRGSHPRSRKMYQRTSRHLHGSRDAE